MCRSCKKYLIYNKIECQNYLRRSIFKGVVKKMNININKNLSQMKKYREIYFFVFLNAFLIFCDQIVKLIIENNMNLHDSFAALGFFRITYVQNYGAAFSILSGQKIVLIVITLLIISFLIAFFIKKQIKDLLYIVSIVMVTAGGIGNLIDRIFRGYVVDYFDIKIWPFDDFAIFNFADCLVVVGAIIFAIKFIISEFFHTKT